ncbi:hypothetical protein KDD30_17250 (plasmid) [Photobacterium sp. GJ3]|uniref:hypothetical protein n=1 Tax=Photobacterium sp. GJ3 TaxID=2829502 RepID=UPI001B8CC665|nr:hypothetical protein [Photobacterium sp. GJ3]QUJ69916.1 hypothetical protein KDD30_17250 [Photobacterium sp. GJ3]
MSNKTLTLKLDELICNKATGESGHDEIYMKIWVDDDYWGTWPSNADESNTFDMNDSDDKYKKVSLDLLLEYGDYVKIELREQDKEGNPDKDEVIGQNYIYTDSVQYADTSTHNSNFTGENANYDLNWRILSQKIPSLRVLGVYCQKSSSNCNQALIDDISGAASDVASAASEIIGQAKTPKAEVISEAFAIASDVILAVASLAEWLANTIEGDDDVYLQETWDGQQSTDGAGFCPGNGQVIKLNDDEEFIFMPEYHNYFRFPLDNGPVTIEIREQDKLKHDISLGAFTIDMNDYQNLVNQGATVMVLTKYQDRNGGQGAIYHICYSCALEDWSLPANQDA